MMSAQSGIDIRLSDKKWATELVTCVLKNVELENALDQILSNFNYILSYQSDENHNITSVVIQVYERQLENIVKDDSKNFLGDGGDKENISLQLGMAKIEKGLDKQSNMLFVLEEEKAISREKEEGHIDLSYAMRKLTETIRKGRVEK